MIRKYTSIYLSLIAQNLKSMLEYRADFTTMFIFTIFSQISGLLFIYIIFDKIPSIQGWNVWEITFLYGIIFFTEGVQTFLFQGSWLIGGLINTGQLDRYLLRPVPIFLQIISLQVNFDGIGKIVISLLIMIYSIINLNLSISISKILVFLMLLLSAKIIRIALNFTANCISFWMKSGTSSIPHFVFNLSEFGKYPITIFSSVIQILMLTLIPYAFISFFPASFLLEKEHLDIIGLFTPLIAIIWIFIAKIVFMMGLKQYESSGN